MNNKTIELNFTEVCALGEVLEFALEGMDNCDDRFAILLEVLNKVDS